MKIFNDISELSPLKNVVVTTGSFDGVHVGHKTILKRIINMAKQIDGESVLITFYPHPRRVLFPAERNLQLITSQEEKIFRLQATGLDNLLIIPFTIEFSKTSSIDFIRQILVAKLHAKHVVVGFNHYFGHNREGNFEHLYELGKYYGFTVEEIPEQDIQNETVSSTKIRKALIDGYIQRANAYLDHFYFITGELTKGSYRCEKNGLNTANLRITEEFKLLPPDGLYAVSFSSGNNTERGMLNIKRTTDDIKDSRNVKLELCFLEQPENITKTVSVNLHKKIRDLMEFDSEKQMLEQLNYDREVVSELIY